MKFAIPVAVLFFAIVGISRSSPSLNWEKKFSSFAEKLAKFLNGTTLPSRTRKALHLSSNSTLTLARHPQAEEIIPRFKQGAYERYFVQNETDFITLVLTSSAYAPDEWYKIVQDKIPKTARFPCHYDDDKPKWRSKKTPTSVHELRPGDIDVIMVIGDSLSAGAAAMQPTPLGFFTDDRGVSFVGGGEKTWREFTTLPNILKEFNPNLYGYAVGKGTFFSENARLNVAISGSTDDDILLQAQYLAQKVSTDSNIDVANDWKLINIFIGHNDICTYHCSDPVNNSPDAHKLRIQEVLDLIYANVPKVFVNLISVLDPTLTARYENTPACEILRNVLCPCLLTSPDLQANIVQMSAVAREYQQKEKELASDVRYQGRNDFAVVWQPLFLAVNGPTAVGEPESPAFLEVFSPEMPIWTPECFHFNQRGSALAARMLWNNMLEPVGHKSSTFEKFCHDTIKCPSKSHPYIFTAKNSKSHHKFSHH